MLMPIGATEEVKTKASLPHTLIEEKNVSETVSAYFEIVHLKQLYRQGWLRSGIPTDRCESVAEHSFGVAMLALLLLEGQTPTLDKAKVLSMALIHDLGEVYAGDFTPADNITAEEKSTLEHESIEKILLKLPGAESYVDIWEEYEAGISPEARFVRELDRLEMSLQASVYQQQELLPVPEEFFRSTRRVVESPNLSNTMDELEALAREYSENVPTD